VRLARAAHDPLTKRRYARPVLRGRVVVGISLCAGVLATACVSADAAAPPGRIAFVTNRAPTLLRVVHYSVLPTSRRRRLVAAESPNSLGLSRDGRLELVSHDSALFVRNRGTRRETRLTSGPIVPVVQAGAAFSPNGKKVAFTGYTQPTEVPAYHVYVVNVDGTKLRDLAAGLAPSWSADGALIAYGGHPAMNSPTTLDVVRADGSGRHSLGPARSLNASNRVIWSPIGHRLAFAARSILLIDADGRHRRSVPRVASQLIWSPNGRWLAFNAGRAASLSLVRADGRGLRRLASDASWNVPMAWSPAGDRLVVARGQAHVQLTIVRVVDGRPVRTITQEPAGTWFSAVRWTGGRISYGAYLMANDGEVATISTAGAGFRLLTRDGYNENDPAPSPDGKRVAFAKDDGNNFWLFTMKADGSGQRRLSPPGRRKDRAPAWSPDGKRIAFVSFAGTGGLAVINADGTGLHMLAKTVSGPRISWSPDGRRIAFAAPVGPAIEIFTVGVDGNDLRQVTDQGLAVSPAYSPDGSRLLFNVLSGSDNFHDLATIRVDGSEFRRVAVSTVAFNGGDWSPDGTRIVFAHGNYEHSRIVTASSDGGDEKRVTNAPGRNISPAWLR
jgi:Tol biopolymer transport system component